MNVKIIKYLLDLFVCVCVYKRGENIFLRHNFGRKIQETITENVHIKEIYNKYLLNRC